MSDNEEYYHNKGQGDGYDGIYDPPHGIIDDFTTWSSSGMDKNQRRTMSATSAITMAVGNTIIIRIGAIIRLPNQNIEKHIMPVGKVPRRVLKNE